ENAEATARYRAQSDAMKRRYLEIRHLIDYKVEPEIKNPVSGDTVDQFALGSQAQHNEPHRDGVVDPLDVLLREFLESLKEDMDEEAPDGEEE
ncbi:MAG: hypothetical protein V2B18_08110, partial [Pseudomonadota bacterium]